MREFLPEMIAKKAQDSAVAEPFGVNFAGVRLDPERPVPQGCEQCTVASPAKTIGTLAAHPGSSGGSSDAAGARERVEETKLTLGRPAVAADSWKGALTHRPAWTTKAAL